MTRAGLPLAIAFLALFPSPAAALIGGTAHDFEFGPVEPDPTGCVAVCHAVADAQAFHAGSGSVPYLRGMEKPALVERMCGGCHRSGGGFGAVMSDAVSDRNAFDGRSHGRKVDVSRAPAATDAAGSGFPVHGKDRASLLCTTCHDPHNDASRPFLRAAPEALCARCHPRRNYVAGAESSGAGAVSGNWDVGLFLGPSNPGSHPVGEDVVEGRPDRPVVRFDARLRTPRSPGPRRWSAGPHLSGGASGGVTCVTCHAVHGAAPDRDDGREPGDASPPNPRFLPIAGAPSAVPAAGADRSASSVDTGPLCQACHGVGNNPTATPGGERWGDPARNVSPGRAGAFSHPVDSYPSSYETGVTAFPSGWPEGPLSIAGKNVSPTPACGTCHATHPASVAVSRGRDAGAAAPYLLRPSPAGAEPGQGSCGACHVRAVPGHHPVGKEYDSTGVYYLRNVRRGPSDRLECSTCHGSAHDWKAPGRPALDPGWKPADNGRQSSQERDMYNPDMSKTCMDCHYGMDGDAGSVNPTMGTRQTVIGSGDEQYPHYQTVDRGMGTHYIGLVHEGGAWGNAPKVDIFDTGKGWAQQLSSYGGVRAGRGWARFGGENRNGERVLVCESCHELEPDRNDGIRHQLLAPYEEGRNGMDEYPGDQDGRDILCDACHGTVKGTHPLTGDRVSVEDRPIDPKGKSIRKPILGNVTMGADGALSCDSCHQPHDANSASNTYILDAPDAVAFPRAGSRKVVGATEGSRPSPATTSYPVVTYATPRKTIDFFYFCCQCHDRE